MNPYHIHKLGGPTRPLHMIHGWARAQVLKYFLPAPLLCTKKLCDLNLLKVIQFRGGQPKVIEIIDPPGSSTSCLSILI